MPSISVYSLTNIFWIFFAIFYHIKKIGKSGVVSQTCNSRAFWRWKNKSQEFMIIHPWLPGKYKASLGYMRSCLKCLKENRMVAHVL